MFAAAAAAFIAIFVAEFGDKTQLVTLTMACRYPPLQVLTGAMVALAAVIGLAVGAGELLSAAVPQSLLTIISGLFFIGIGLFTYLRREPPEVEAPAKDGFLQTLGMVFIAEFGDKTQLAAVFLVASLGYPWAVFTGAMVAMFFNHLLAVYLGSCFISRVNPLFLKRGTAGLFVVIGMIIIATEAGSIL